MSHKLHHHRWSALLAGTAAAGLLVVSAVLPVSALGQGRNGSERGSSGSSSGTRGGSYSRSAPSAPRSESAPRTQNYGSRENGSFSSRSYRVGDDHSSSGSTRSDRTGWYYGGSRSSGSDHSTGTRNSDRSSWYGRGSNSAGDRSSGTYHSTGSRNTDRSSWYDHANRDTTSSHPNQSDNTARSDRSSGTDRSTGSRNTDRSSNNAGDRSSGSDRSTGARNSDRSSWYDRAGRDTTSSRSTQNDNAVRSNRGESSTGYRVNESRTTRPGDISERSTAQRNAVGGVSGHSIATTPNRGFSNNNAHDIFSRSREGRQFENGIVLRSGHVFHDDHFGFFFPWGYSYFPFYCPTFTIGLTFYSPYGYYYGCCPPYIYRENCFYFPPPAIFVDVPIYVGDDCRGYTNDNGDYYLNRSNSLDPDLTRAIDNIRDAFRQGDIEPLVQVTDPKVKIAIYLRGKYDYSLDPKDYLDMTRDALRTTDTIQFDLTRIHRRAEGVYVASGKHVYRDKDGRERTVYVSFVLERISGEWTLTQVGTAPDHIQEW